uniref:AAA family ATPase n=1 Tax=Altererythrobacter segetis TaxID=1104773 RepID=UPI00140AA420|nr:P-loop NTPase [Altererythrobacter segetis]
MKHSDAIAGGIFASPDFLSQFSRTEIIIGGVPMEVQAVPASAPLDRDRLAALGLAVIEVRPDEQRSIERLISLTAALPEVAVIAAISMPDVALVRTLLREGVADVVSLPFNHTELNQVVLEVLARQADRETKLHPLIGVVKASGGSGATSTATQLVGKLADNDWGGEPPLLVDLDVQFGTVAEYFSIEQSGSILDLLRSTERLDDALAHSIAIKKDRFSVVIAPKEIVPLETVDLDSLLNTVQFMRMHFGAVVVDLPPCWTDWSLSLLAECDLVLMVGELSLHGLRQARRNLDLMDSIGISRQKVRLVLNKVEKKLFGSLRPEDAERTLNCEVVAVLPLEDALGQAQQAGESIYQHARKSKYAQELTKLAESVRALVGDGSKK